ncbi:PH and SEC7 domain-containing protein 3 [Silurus asotus]|uniref:PH and SEC7 domain-containing protein 3 n=1 Tax=Silurus asotus TaxID=30991 RepID=A0AAD5FEU9_SILAS|nr:PH and SEC7 domain-containing protein 3 [Silurus asotus]
MGDHHQVKTSFLFIQLQSPSREQQCQPSADSRSLDTPEEVSSATTAGDVARATVGDLEIIYTREQEIQPALDDTLLQSVDSEPIPEEAPSPPFAAGITKISSPDSDRIDITSAKQGISSSSCERLGDKTDSQECLSYGFNKSEKDRFVERVESSVRLSGQDPTENMSKVVQPPSLEENFPKPSIATRASFLYPSTAPHGLNPTPTGVPPASSFPSTHRPPHSGWVHSAKHKEEAAAQEKAPTMLSKNPERTTFVSAVIQRSSKLYEYVYKPALSSTEVTSDAEKSSENLSLAVVGAAKPNQTALAAEPLHPEKEPSAMNRSSAPEKHRCCYVSMTYRNATETEACPENHIEYRLTWQR